jgi:glycosyltransferase involved in cell wall biosynthesis/predicted O-methyltransferase YrrM
MNPTDVRIENAKAPLVSCIMPTYNRRAFVPHAIRYFLRQDYKEKELIIIDDGTDCIEDLVPADPSIRYYRLPKKITLGAKLNMACNYANGNIIANWDDDDWYAPGRLTYQIKAMQPDQIYICGINKLLYLDLNTKNTFQYIYPDDQRTWLLGSSLCFKKEFWKKSQFADINVGMDGLFVWTTTDDHIYVLPDHTFSVHMIHYENVSPKKTDGIWWHKFPAEGIIKIMGTDWDLYSKNGNSPVPFEISGYKIEKSKKLKKKKLIKNIHACLVHENENCIIDLVRNLNYQDPDSIILLYNGSNNPGLINSHFDYKKYGAVIHPGPVPQKHGYLHQFALDCMQYALENFSFDTLTIVDSDQLCIRPGYSEYLSEFFSSATNVGMLSMMAMPVLPDNKTNLVAAAAFKEYELWKPLVESYPDGKNKFVYWTFWPSTVFTAGAARDLVKMFKENKLLQQIMKETKIWATEEIIFPTLISLLGYGIAANPCSYDFVKYRRNYTTTDINSAMKRPDVYWIHPVPRQYEQPIRKYIRERSAHYTHQTKINMPEKKSKDNLLLVSALINRVKKIKGWLSDAEADLLIATALKACTQSVPPQHIVEIGSFHGKSTVALGNVVKYLFPSAKVFAIDPHEGTVGAVDQGLQTLSPTLQEFRKNIEHEDLTEVVELIHDYSYNVKWKKPIQMIFIDGLHDYPSVSKDFRHFSKWIVKNGYVAFHDYADYYPGVKTFVNELMESGEYNKMHQADSLIVVQKK